MNVFYWGLAVLTVWGDAIKPYMPGEQALAVLYAGACLLLLVLYASGGWRLRSIAEADTSLASNAALFLVLVYFFQWSMSVYAPVREGLNHLLYMAIPLAYLILIPRCRPDFDHAALANRVLLLMVPVNVIGLVQYTVDPTFFISTAYSGEGGIIRRNLLYGAAFERFPSIYASADRYSAMALMQFCYAIILFDAPGRGRGRMAWIAFNLVAGLAALAVAGARSRIIIVVALAVIVAAVYVGQRLLTARREQGGWTLAAFSVALVFALGALVAREARQEEYSIFAFLQQSVLERDLNQRIEQAVTSSLLPTQVSAFGEGLGSIGVGGKPGEFGVRAIWAESGVIWGSLLMLGFFGILLALTRSGLAAMQAHRVTDMALPVLAALILATALLTGLTAAFELSSGLLLACAIVLAVRGPPPAATLRP